MSQKIPQVVIDKAQSLINLYGEHCAFLGQTKMYDVYIFQFPEDSMMGYPILFLYNTATKSATTVTGMEALAIIEEIC